MHIVKQENGLYKVTLKGVECPFYVENYNDALQIIFKLGGMANGR